jgi:hypothetical protein
MSLMDAAEFVLWAVLNFLFWKKELHRRFPAMWGYLALHLASMPILLFLEDVPRVVESIQRRLG